MTLKWFRVSHFGLAIGILNIFHFSHFSLSLSLSMLMRCGSVREFDLSNWIIEICTVSADNWHVHLLHFRCHLQVVARWMQNEMKWNPRRLIVQRRIWPAANSSLVIHLAAPLVTSTQLHNFLICPPLLPDWRLTSEASQVQCWSFSETHFLSTSRLHLNVKYKKYIMHNATLQRCTANNFALSGQGALSQPVGWSHTYTHR